MTAKKKALSATKKTASAAAKAVVDKGPKPTRIRLLRERSRLTQEELSVLTGMDVTTISKHETGSRGVDEEAVRLYARVFKTSSYELFVPPEVEDKYDGEAWSVFLPGSQKA